jgi:hypothetical protein
MKKPIVKYLYLKAIYQMSPPEFIIKLLKNIERRNDIQMKEVSPGKEVALYGITKGEKQMIDLFKSGNLNPRAYSTKNEELIRELKEGLNLAKKPIHKTHLRIVGDYVTYRGEHFRVTRVMGDDNILLTNKALHKQFIINGNDPEMEFSYRPGYLGMDEGLNLEKKKIKVIQIKGCVETTDNFGAIKNYDSADTLYILKNPMSWTDDIMFVGPDGMYFIDDLIGKAVWCNGESFVVKESENLSEGLNLQTKTYMESDILEFIRKKLGTQFNKDSKIAYAFYYGVTFQVAYDGDDKCMLIAAFDLDGRRKDTDEVPVEFNGNVFNHQKLMNDLINYFTKTANEIYAEDLRNRPPREPENLPEGLNLQKKPKQEPILKQAELAMKLIEYIVNEFPQHHEWLETGTTFLKMELDTNDPNLYFHIRFEGDGEDSFSIALERMTDDQDEVTEEDWQSFELNGTPLEDLNGGFDFPGRDMINFIGSNPNM